jgi:hypothetical protein
MDNLHYTRPPAVLTAVGAERFTMVERRSSPLLIVREEGRVRLYTPNVANARVFYADRNAFRRKLRIWCKAQ